ncbi:DNA oxidative demethylase AlkB [Acetobacteraceae bacterium ESL0709]|nr:DNA oxidative demethylase AlkB [Acetobacteraceae bacterium ESL0697]MDF7677906.1 DNA oxidative demethylase AlkB [Acetobacteraceae bacterium ESL0709]
MPDLFLEERRHIILSPGAILLGGFALNDAEKLLVQIDHLATFSPFRHMITPGGKIMSVAMLSSGTLGWVSDQKGYHYTHTDPKTGKSWPPLPPEFLALAQNAARSAGYHDFKPDSCLVNRYVPGARLTLHQDKDERDQTAPIVSVSLGLAAYFLWGGLQRHEHIKRHKLFHGDVVVWGGHSRLAFHGIAPLEEEIHPLTGSIRYNLTFRKSG